MENFKDLNLSAELAAAIEELGYKAPTPIQAQTLPLLLEGPTDFLGLAATGTGKTAAFGIPALEQLQSDKRVVQTLVLCPTRELALQVTEQLNLLGKHKRCRAVPIYGGAGYGDQIRGLKSGAQIVVATPGRLIDHLEKGSIDLSQVRTVILDEADEMISMGFKEEIESILETIPAENRKTWLFSATMSREVRRVADRFLTAPKMVQVNKTEMLSGTVRQIYYKVKETDKPDILCKLIEAADDFYGLIFCQTKSLVMDLTNLLINRGYKVECLHGDKDQNQRERTMRAFRERRVNILVCTDVASRGLDVKDLTHVINYSIPRELDNYVHRIGRTGRRGTQGLALSLVTASHMGLVGRIEKMTQSKMELGVIPTRKEISSKKVAKVLERFKNVAEHQRAIDALDEAWLETLEAMSKTEIASRLLVLTFPDLFVDRQKSSLTDLPGKPAEHGRRAHVAARDYPFAAAPAVLPTVTPVKKSHAEGQAAMAQVQKKVERLSDRDFDSKKPRSKGPWTLRPDAKPFGERRYGDRPAYKQKQRFDGGGKPAFGEKKRHGESSKQGERRYGTDRYSEKRHDGGSVIVRKRRLSDSNERPDHGRRGPKKERNYGDDSFRSKRDRF